MRTAAAVIALAAAGLGLWWRGYRAGRRNSALLKAAARINGWDTDSRDFAALNAEVRRILSS